MARAGIFLLLGAIVNVAVAWGCVLALESHQWQDVEQPTVEEVEWWNRSSPQWIQSEPTCVRRATCLGVRADSIWVDEPRMHVAPQSVTRIRAGLPLRSFDLESWYDSTTLRDPPSTRRILERGVWVVRVPRNVRPEILLPLRPLWAGLVTDTILGALVFWSLYEGCCWFRRVRRLGRGLCPMCGYPIGISPVCTECGEALPERTAT